MESKLTGVIHVLKYVMKITVVLTIKTDLQFVQIFSVFG